ncbi:MAG: hypothetical protein HGA75_16705 [Thiobacillus sp.]|nr:hypothetical protein [Thiobacillus sp.]
MKVKAYSRLSGIILIAVAASAISFYVGRWSGYLKSSLQREADYPMALQRKIGSVDIQCHTLLQEASIHHFLIRQLDDGETLVIASYDDRARVVRAYAISTSGELASDSWPLECNK